jgi:hypothetical protein
MSNYLLIGVIFLMSFVTMLRGGSVVKLSDGSEVGGKLTLNPSSIHVEGSSTSDIDLGDVLEADFPETPFHLDYFSSSAGSALPASWKAEDIGQVTVPGAFSYSSGDFTLTSGQWDAPSDNSDHCYFAGMPWTGNGQWTVRLKSVGSAGGVVHGGFMLRDSLDPLSAITGISGWDSNNVFMYARNATHGTWANVISIDSYPVWFRLTREGLSVNFEISSNGEKWTLINLSTMAFSETVWAGFFVDHHQGKADQKIVIDQVLFTPAPGLAPTQSVTTGLLLCSGSFVSGYYSPIDFTSADPVGYFMRNEKNQRIEIVASKTAAAVYHPVTRKQLADVASQTGVILKNGDFMDGNFEAINAGGVRLNSVLLGTASYNLDQVCACSLHPMKPLPADYEIRLKDGSSILASSVALNNGQISVAEVSGITFNVAPEEIAQFRAGPSRVQSLLGLAWKVTPAPSTIVAQCWMGNNQEQVMVLPVKTTVNFPLAGRFRAMALRVGLSPDSPPDSQATIHVLADGKEIAITPAFKAGDQPRFMEVTLQDPQTVSLFADSSSPATRILFVDPVAIRENGSTKP